MDYDKLVRDYIPKIIKEHGERPYTHIAQGSELEAKLWEKLDEEIEEFRESGAPEELTDVLEVVYAIAEFYALPREQLEALRKEKAERRGGFSQGIILEKVE